MEQPQLGNFILQLRKQQGLTQQELVDKCRVTVRTIQRIEAGEVTPRSYTLRTILEALGKNIDDVFIPKPAPTKHINYAFNKKWLIAGFISGILFLITSSIGTISVIFEMMDEKVLSNGIHGLLNVIQFITATLLYITINHYAQVLNHRLLKGVSIAVIVSTALILLADYNLYTGVIDDGERIGAFISISVMFLYGLQYLFLGIGFFTLRKKSGELVKWTGLTGIVTGISFLLILFFPVAIIASLIFDICVLIILYQALQESKD